MAIYASLTAGLSSEFA